MKDSRQIFAQGTYIKKCFKKPRNINILLRLLCSLAHRESVSYFFQSCTTINNYNAL